MRQKAVRREHIHIDTEKTDSLSLTQGQYEEKQLENFEHTL
jgi:hypothetical protein